MAAMDTIDTMLNDINVPALVRRRAASAARRDPDQVPVQCEAPGCDIIKPHGQMCSMWVVYGMPGPGKSPYYCPLEQHYGCCHAHAKAAMLACLETHIEGGDHA